MREDSSSDMKLPSEMQLHKQVNLSTPTDFFLCENKTQLPTNEVEKHHLTLRRWKTHLKQSDFRENCASFSGLHSAAQHRPRI